MRDLTHPDDRPANRDASTGCCPASSDRFHMEKR